MTIKTTPIQTTPDDLHKVVRAGHRIGSQDIVQWGLFALMIVCFLLSYMTSASQNGKNPGIIPLLAGLGLLTLIIAGSIGIKQLDARFQLSKLTKSGAFGHSVVFEFDPEFVQVQDDQSNQSRVRWTEYRKVTKSPDYYFLYLNKKSFQWIPFRSFASAEDIEAFERLVVDRGLLRKR
ncbi:MAG: hypothetical protein DPW16_01830 [Chloroflexi bacterium]|nr:hypothetical protein [Chloroflexota bacterium]